MSLEDVMATANQKNEKQFKLGRIEYLEYVIDLFEANEGHLDRTVCKEHIHSLENVLAKYRAELFMK
jgi:hypothetical protein